MTAAASARGVEAELADLDVEPDLCTACNGSGEGGYDGSRCTVCRGHGEVCAVAVADDGPPSDWGREAW